MKTSLLSLLSVDVFQQYVPNKGPPMSAHRKDPVFKIWYRNKVVDGALWRITGSIEKMPPFLLLDFSSKQSRERPHARSFISSLFLSAFHTQKMLADLRLADETGGRDEQKRTRGRRGKAEASSLWCGKWKWGWDASQLWNVIPCRNGGTESKSSSNNSSFWSHRCFWSLQMFLRTNLGAR